MHALLNFILVMSKVHVYKNNKIRSFAGFPCFVDFIFYIVYLYLWWCGSHRCEATHGQ
jgi:hypothetical protein